MKKRRFFKVIFSLFLTFTLIANLLVNVYGANATSKVTSNLLQKMSTNKNKKNLVSIWLAAPDISNVKKNTETQIASLSSQYSKKNISNDSHKEALKSAQTIKLNYRSSVKSVYVNNNTNFSSKYLDENSIIYVSQYAPMIIANLSNQEILELNAIDEVISLDCYEESKFDSATAPLSSQQESTSENLVSSMQLDSYTGAGVNIGVMDGGIPNTTETAGMNVVATLGEYNGTHPGFVAGILGDIAPDANYYFVGNVPNMSYVAQIEWLLDQGVDVINMSLAIGGDGNSVYGNYTKWFEHIAYNHYILIVKSAGNTNGVISCPGMAYNIMTVGAMNKKSNIYYLETFSGYYNGSTHASKPDICALGRAGTSEAAPRVTAAAALLIEADYLLTYSPELIKAILVASVDVSSNYHFQPTYRSTAGINYMQAGAGLLDIDNALETTANYQTSCAPINQNNTSYTYNFNISSSDVGSVVRVALAYNVPVDADINHTNEQYTAYTIPNLDLQLFTPDNSTSPAFVSGSANNNNVEIIEFTPSAPGIYTIKVITVTGTTPTENVYFGIAWSVQ